MIAEELKLVIRAETNNAIANLEKFTAKTHQADTGVKGITSNMLKWAAGMGAAMISINTLRRAIRYAFDASQVAAETNQISKALDSMARSSGISTDTIVKNLKRASGGTIAELDLMKSASKAALFELPLNQIDKLMEIARASATATGQSVQYMFDSIVTGIARSSPMILDNLGLTIKIGDATKNYAKSIGKTTEELTAEEKKMATLNAVLEAGGRMLDRVGDSAREFTDAERVQRYKAAMQDLKTEVGQSLLPAFRQVTAASTTFVENLTESLRITRAFNNIGSGKSSLEDRLIAINYQIDLVRDNLRTATSGQVDIRGATRLPGKTIEALEKERDALLRQKGELERIESIKASAEAAAEKRMRAEEARAVAAAEKVQKLRDAYAQTEEGQRAAIDTAIKYWEAQLSSGRDTKEIEAILKGYREQIEETRDSMWNLASNTASMENRNSALSKPFIELSDTLGTATDGLQDWIAAQTEIVAGFPEMSLAQLGLNDLVSNFADNLNTKVVPALKNYEDEARAVASAMAPFTDAIGMMAIDAEEGWAMFAQAAKDAISSFLRMLGEKAFVQALEAFAEPFGIGVPRGIRLMAAGTAAMVASGVVKAMAEGGIVTQPTQALIGERGPEAVIPLGKMGGMGTRVVVHVYGSVMEGENLARKIGNIVARQRRGY